MFRNYLLLLSALTCFLCISCSPVSQNQTNVNSNLGSGKSYYVSITTGSDKNDGSSPKRAWKTLARANQHTFQPGENLLLKAGDIWSDTVGLAPKGNGVSNKPITVASYGEGTKPVINITAGMQNSLTLTGQSNWVLRDIEVRSANHNGVAIDGLPNTKVENIKIINITARDCSPGFAQREFDHCGIRAGKHGGKGNPKGTYFENIEIDGCTVDNSAVGIMIAGPMFDETKPVQPTDPVSKNNKITNCKASNLRGDGIVIFCGANSLIEKSVCYNASTYNKDNKCTAAIWTWNVRDMVVRFCESYGHYTPGCDRQPFDIDYESYNTVFEYNYGHDSFGSGILLCAPKGTNDVVTFRYNVIKYCGSGDRQNGFVHFYDFDNETSRKWVYNNTFVGNPPNITNGKNANTQFYNNIFYHTTGLKYQGSIEKGQHDNNLWFNITDYPKEANGITADPKFVNILDTGIGACDGLKLQAGSPAIDKGADLTKLPTGITSMGTRDYWGNTLPRGKGYDIGAHEF